MTENDDNQGLGATIEQALFSLFSQKMNFQVQCYTDSEKTAWFYVRGIPYGGKRKADVMFVGAGGTFRDAIQDIIKSVARNQERDLSWTYKPGKWVKTEVAALSSMLEGW